MGQPVNNGQKVYTLLVEYNVRTGLPTGRIKPNIPTDPNYIPPVEDLGTCPLPSGEIPTITIDVDFLDFSAVANLLFGSGSINTVASGPWVVVDRVYDALIVEVTDAPSPQYKIRIEYGNGEVKEITDLTEVGTFLIPGPFVDITTIAITVTSGDFNSDFSNDFYN